MTKAHHPTLQERRERRQNARHRKAYRRHKQNPCPHSPRQLDASTELSGEFHKHPHPLTGAADPTQTAKLHKGRKRHNGWTARLRWNEVNTDSDGFPLIVVRYGVEVQYSADGTDWFMASRHQVPAKDDFDPNTKDHIIVHHIHGRLAYRFRVRAIGRECKAAWSDYYVLGTPEDGPPAPFDVQIKRASHGIRIRWHADMNPTDDDIFTEDIAHFITQLWANSDFGPSLDFTANAGTDTLTTASAHGMTDGDPVVLFGTAGGQTLPPPARAHRMYIANVTGSTTFKLLHPDTLATIDLTATGDGVANCGMVRSARHVHRHHHIFRLDADDFDEDVRFYGRVRSVSDHGSKSAWIPATAPAPNDDPDATPTGRRPAWHRHVFTFSFIDPLSEGVYKRPDRLDDDYRIRRVTVAAHKAGDGTSKFDVKINGSTFVFDGDTTKMPTLAAGDKDAGSKQVVNYLLERGDHIRAQIVTLPGTPPEFVTLHVVADRIQDGSTTDSGGGGGE